MAETIMAIPGVVGRIQITDDDDGIPAFLRIPQEQRRAAWDRWLTTHRYTDARSGPADAEAQERMARFRAAMAAEKKQKNLEALARLKAQHEGEKYDRKLKQWVPI